MNKREERFISSDFFCCEGMKVERGHVAMGVGTRQSGRAEVSGEAWGQGQGEGRGPCWGGQLRSPLIHLSNGP